MPKKVHRNPGVAKRGDKWKARAFFDGREYSKTFSTQDEAVRLALLLAANPAPPMPEFEINSKS
jgi:hypothetical protein